MRLRAVIATFFASALIAQPVFASSQRHAAPVDKLRSSARPSDVLVVAHRGCWGEAPEVSVAAIEACYGTGIDGVEIDVARTRDGALILMHDETVDRTTNGSGAVADLTLAEIRALRLRKGAGGANVVVTDATVPTLEEALRAAKGRFFVHLDYKSASLDEIAAVVRRVGMEGEVTAWLRGLPGDDRQPDATVGETIALVPVIIECATKDSPCRSTSPEALAEYESFRPIGYFLTFRATRAFLRRVAAAERPPFTRIATETLGRIDSEPRAVRYAEWQAMIDLGVTMILTDQPHDLAAFLQGRHAANQKR